MNLSLYRSRVVQHFHRLSTFGLPVAIVLSWLAMDASRVAYGPPNYTPFRQLMVIPLFLGLGAIGRDASDGLLPLLLTRPFRRSTYVISQWAALGTVASFWCLLHLLGQWVLIQLATHSVSLQLAEPLFHAFGRAAMCFGIAASLVCFSTRLPSYGNVVLWVVLFFIAENVLPGLGSTQTSLEALALVRQLLLGLILPELDYHASFGAEPISWFRVTTYASNICLLLLVGIHLFNRREVSYASR